MQRSSLRTFHGARATGGQQHGIPVMALGIMAMALAGCASGPGGPSPGCHGQTWRLYGAGRRCLRDGHDHLRDRGRCRRNHRDDQGDRAFLPRPGRGQAVDRFDDQLRGVAARDSECVERQAQGRRHWRLRWRHAGCADGRGPRGWLCGRRQRHGSRRRRGGRLDDGASGEGQGLGLPRTLFRDHRGEGVDQRVLRPAGGARVLRGVFPMVGDRP
jgi:hypothetical protein